MRIHQFKKGDIIIHRNGDLLFGPIEFLKISGEIFFFSPLLFDEADGEGALLGNTNYIKINGRKVYLTRDGNSSSTEWIKLSKKDFPVIRGSAKAVSTPKLPEGFNLEELKDKPDKKEEAPKETNLPTAVPPNVRDEPTPPRIPGNLPDMGGRSAGFVG